MSVGDARDAAIEFAYELIEEAQGEDTSVRLDAAVDEAVARGWDDVLALLRYAQSFAATYSGQDDAPYLEDMIEVAARIDDPGLYSLALAHTALRQAQSRRMLENLNESTTSLLVRAVGLLDSSDAAVVHRAAALISMGLVAHVLGLWELAGEQYELTEEAYAAAEDGRWAPTVRRQRRALAFNRVDLALDWAGTQASIGDWAGAEARAAAILPGSLEAVDDQWPPSWVVLYRLQLHLLSALAGRDGDPAYAVEPDGEDLTDAVIQLGEAIRAARRGDTGHAALLADGQADRLRPLGAPNIRLLCMSVAARVPGAPASAAVYADELATLRWNARIDQMAGIRDAITVERRRREHEQLRQQVFVDELTGLANRRGYHAYLKALGHKEDEPGAYAVMMIDVDRFKSVNDTFGHDVGDLVLTRIAQVLALNVRPVDLAARLGGDEFVVILAGILPGIPEARAQAILDAVRDHPWDEVAAGLRVSLSIGVHHGGVRELPDLLADADRKLYHAKNEGRGRVAVSTG